jgi:uncharacterized lipoprotein YmbA
MPSSSIQSPFRRSLTNHAHSSSRANRVELDEFNRLAEPLSETIARVIAGDLTVLFGTSQVTTVPLANFDPVSRMTIDIQRFGSVPASRRVVPHNPVTWSRESGVGQRL